MKTLTKLVTGIIFVMSAAQAAAQTPSIRSIRVADSTRLNPAIPMVGEFPAPPIYFRWMKELAECEGLALPPFEEFAKTQYFGVNNDDFQVNDNRLDSYFAVTVADKAGHAVIYISIAKVFDYRIVMHEFLHILLLYNFPDGRFTYDLAKQHPSQYYGICGVKPN